MATIAGFVIGSVLARGLEDEDERRQAALVGGLIPDPLIGALVVSNIVAAAEDGDDTLGTTRSRAVLGSGPGSRRGGTFTPRPRRDASDVATGELMEAWTTFEQALEKAADRDQELAQALDEFRKAVAGGGETDPDAARQSSVNAALASLPGIADAIERAAQAGASAAEAAAAQQAQENSASNGEVGQAETEDGSASSGQQGPDETK